MELFITLLILALLNSRRLVKADGRLDAALDTLVCSGEVEYSPRTIVDINKSVGNGAVLLKGSWHLNKESCISNCCAIEGCNLALFKTEGISKRGNNCYLISCGTPSKCTMVDHGSFLSMTLKQPTSSRKGSFLPPGQQYPAMNGSDVTSTSPDQLPSTSTSTAPQTDSIVTSNAKIGISRADFTAESVGMEHSEKTTPTSFVSSVSLEQINDKGSSIQGAEGKEVKVGECGAYGCDGSGMVAIVVVAAICSAIIIVVGAVLLKKVVEERRRKKFRNVDYLINGMYT